MYNIKNIKQLTGLIATGIILLSCNSSQAANEQTTITIVEQNQQLSLLPPSQNQLDNQIKIALLLDTSGSMDGLIDQAKSQLWKIVNQLALAKKGDAFASIQIALYEYGNDRIHKENGYIRQVVDLTDDLDQISMELFALKTNGGSEFCGQVISKSLSELDWENETNGLQVMFIAGNEPFTQGGVNYEKACLQAGESDITVNTIFCGSEQEGINSKWKHGADLTEGFYGTIQMNEQTVYVETPFDDEIQILNGKLNETYLAFGSQKVFYQSNQSAQDDNADFYGKANSVERTVSKSSHVYKNTKWDLVDAIDEKDFDVKTVKKEELPTEMQEMTLEEKEKYIVLKKKERTIVQKQIQELNAERVKFIAAEKANHGDPKGGLDYAMIEAIKRQAIAKKFTFDSL